MSSRWFLGACLVSALSLAQERQPGKGVNFYSLENEVAIGKQQAADFLRTTRRLRDAAATAYIAELGQRLAERIGGPPFTYTFTVVEGDPSPLHEPVALPGGILFVPARLILAVRDEDELAGMLEHAIARCFTGRNAHGNQGPVVEHRRAADVRPHG